MAYTQFLWPKVNGVATVYYVIDSASDPHATSKIQSAIETSNADFPGVLQWVPWTSADGANYVDINLSASDTSGECEASEGYEAKPAQPMNGSTNCTVTTMNYDATPDTGWSFAGWTYDLTGTTNPTHLTANDETLVFANFNTTTTPLTLISLSPGTASKGGAAFTLTLTGTGFTPESQVSANGKYRTITFVNAETLQVPLTAADVANAGAIQVYVENYPSGWNGCAVFGYQTLLITGSAQTPAATPTFTPAAGTYTSPQSVKIADATAGSTIYYTTNGATPTTSSAKYTGAIAVSASETLKAWLLLRTTRNRRLLPRNTRLHHLRPTRYSRPRQEATRQLRA